MAISSTVQPSRFTREACPWIPNPPLPPKSLKLPGAATAWVIPFALATGMCSLAGWTAAAARICGLNSPSSTRIVGDRDRAHFREPELAHRVHDSGVDLETLGLDDLRTVGDRDVRADFRDPPVADHDGALLDGLTRERHDARSADGVDLVREKTEEQEAPSHRLSPFCFSRSAFRRLSISARRSRSRARSK